MNQMKLFYYLNNLSLQSLDLDTSLIDYYERLLTGTGKNSKISFNNYIIGMTEKQPDSENFLLYFKKIGHFIEKISKKSKNLDTVAFTKVYIAGYNDDPGSLISYEKYKDSERNEYKLKNLNFTEDHNLTYTNGNLDRNEPKYKIITDLEYTNSKQVLYRLYDDAYKLFKTVDKPSNKKETFISEVNVKEPFVELKIEKLNAPHTTVEGGNLVEDGNFNLKYRSEDKNFLDDLVKESETEFYTTATPDIKIIYDTENKKYNINANKEFVEGELFSYKAEDGKTPIYKDVLLFGTAAENVFIEFIETTENLSGVRFKNDDSAVKSGKYISITGNQIEELKEA